MAPELYTQPAPDIDLQASGSVVIDGSADLAELYLTDPVSVAIATALRAGGLSCYPGFLPPQTADNPYERYPCVTYRQIGGGRTYTHGGSTGLLNPLWELNAWATNYDAARLLASAAMDALEASLDAELTASRDDREPNTGATRIILTVNVWI